MIASQTADYYEIALRHQKNDPKSKFNVQWIAQMRSKSALFSSIAHFHAPSALPADLNVGERIARLKLAQEFVMKSVENAHKAGKLLLNSVNVL